jgi:hypothetical protein
MVIWAAEVKMKLSYQREAYFLHYRPRKEVMDGYTGGRWNIEGRRCSGVKGDPGM